MEINLKLDDIRSAWKVDAAIDRYNLTEESLKCSNLHSKYYEIYMNEKSVLNRESENFKNFELAKTYWYSGKMDKTELVKMGWQPFNIHLLKGDIPKVVESDQDIIDKRLKIMEQQDKVEFVKSILQSINQRTYQIRNANDNNKFESGG